MSCGQLLLMSGAKGKRFVTPHSRICMHQISSMALGKLAAFAGVSEFPTRVKCATLAWQTMHTILKGTSSSVSTE